MVSLSKRTGTSNSNPAVTTYFIEGPDSEEFRLTNKLARWRAERLLTQADEMFY